MQQETLSLPHGGRKQVVYRAGSGPAVVWIHGLYGVEGDEPFVSRLAERFSVVAPLAQGFSDLDELDGLDSVHDLALHYDDVLEALGIDQALVVGHSFGAMIAAELAAHVPRRVGRLVLIAPFGLWRDDDPVEDIFAVPYADMAKLLYVDPPEELKDVDEFAVDERVEQLISLAQGMTTVAKFVWPIPERGLERRLPRISAPTLVVWGADDAVVPRSYADLFAAAIPDSHVAVIDGAGHMVPLERTEAVSEAIEHFAGVGSAA
jgi:pimeloyl-ACP methyl ester carboxylesterase